MIAKFTQEQIGDHFVVAKHLARITEMIVRRGSESVRIGDSDIPIPALIQDRASLVKAIADDINSSSYSIGAASRKILRIDKLRVIYEFDLIDRVVMSVLGEFLNLAVARFVPSNVHSFMKGKSNKTAIQSLARGIRKHYEKAASPAHRELIVWRLDVKSYTDSIPVGDVSEIWSLLSEFTCKYFEDSAWVLRTLKQGIRPVIVDHPNFKLLFDSAKLKTQQLDGPAMNIIGTTTGCAFAPFVANIYLKKFDRFLASQPGFYVRYGDDIAFVAPRGQDAASTIGRARGMIHQLGLEPNSSKEKMILLTGRGRVLESAELESIEGIKIEPRQSLDYLGWQINHRGDFQPSTEKITRDLSKLKRRLFNIYYVLNHGTGNIGSFTSEKNESSRLPRLAGLFRVKNSRSELNFIGRKVTEKLTPVLQKSLDRSVAKSLSSLLTGVAGPKTFRYLSWRELIEQYGLRNAQRFFKKNKSKEKFRK